MKTIHLLKADLLLQCLMAIVNLGLGVWALMDNVGLILMLYFQIVINLYHFVTNLIHLQAVDRNPIFTKYRKYYRNLCLVYVPSAILFTMLFF